MANYIKTYHQMIKTLELVIQKSESGISAEELIYHLTLKYEVLPGAITKRLLLLKKMELINENMGLLKWNGRLTKE